MTPQELSQSIGQQIGHSGWTEVSQRRISDFADVTEDWQPIHLDPEAGRAAGFDGTVAHGFLSLALLSKMSYEALPVIEGQTASINYGFDRIRFLAPVPGGAQLRAQFTLSDIEPRGDASLMLLLDVTLQIRNQERPALAALWRVLILLQD